MHLLPPTDLSVESAPATPALDEARLRVITDACRADTPEQRKLLVCALYEDGILSMDETTALFARLGLAEA
ncbi:hypothetical protein [Azospirillum doebereinerae]|uniref:Uncharacterized protein n=1 Tax=Azospirillum doebereinerae TaxID=92933 RepID=A0A3S0WRM6_9PROT|nr:hypothetical protein [Azospirillum doebereinerae]RUQ65170.1 hypothetical protein EJ913_25840 [Azospirillum doebereinerae]